MWNTSVACLFYAKPLKPYEHMKKYLIFILISTIVVTAVPVRAASVGSPKTEGQGKIAVTAEWSYIFNRDLDFKKATRPAGAESYIPESFQIVKGYNTAAKVSYGLFDAMDVYIKLGVADYDLKGDVYVGDIKHVVENLSGANAFLYGGGFKLAQELKDGWIVGFDAQYLTSANDLDFRAVNIISGATSVAKYIDCRIQEWHVAPYLAKKIANFTPYFGAKYSALRLTQAEPNDPKRWDDLVFNADCNVGVFTGLDWNFAKNFTLNIEGRFVDETAMSIGVEYKF